jgi:hypothetical protein
MRDAKVLYSQVADILENFVERRGGQWDWDNFITTTVFTDPYLKNVQQRMVHLSDEFPAQNGSGYCNAKGLEVIRTYVQELRSKTVAVGQDEQEQDNERGNSLS